VAARQGLARLDAEPDLFGSYAERARDLAQGLAEVPGLRVHPQPPHTNAFVLYADVPASALEEASLQLAEASRVWLLGRVAEADVPGWAATELVVGAATLEWPVAELVEQLAALVAKARAIAG
jgi:threonine aldolase